MVLSTIVQAAAGAAVAWFAFAQWRSDSLKKTARVADVESRISTIAFQLRRQVRSWLGIDSKSQDGLESWLRDAQNAGSYKTHLDTAERRLENMSSLAGEATESVATRVRMAFVLFLGGTRRLNQYASTERPRGEGEFDWMRLREDAEKDLKACVEALEAGVINAELLNADKELDEIRDAEDPFRQLAEAMMRRAVARK
jgi:uncharacterized membrane protein YccC